MSTVNNKKPHRFVPVLAAIIQNEKGEVLIARRRQELQNGNKWEFPGGKLQTGETPEQGLRREIKEELGIDIDVMQPYHIVVQSGTDFSILLVSYLCRHHSERFRLCAHSRVLWVSPAELLRFPMTDADVRIVQKLCENGLVDSSF